MPPPRQRRRRFKQQRWLQLQRRRVGQGIGWAPSPCPKWVAKGPWETPRPVEEGGAAMAGTWGQPRPLLLLLLQPVKGQAFQARGLELALPLVEERALSLVEERAQVLGLALPPPLGRALLWGAV